VLISFEGRQVTVVAGPRAARLIAALQQAGDDPAAVQLLLAKATGHFKHGTERKDRGAAQWWRACASMRG
jgi:hypothetical protein